MMTLSSLHSAPPGAGRDPKRADAGVKYTQHEARAAVLNAYRRFREEKLQCKCLTALMRPCASSQILFGGQQRRKLGSGGTTRLKNQSALSHAKPSQKQFRAFERLPAPASAGAGTERCKEAVRRWRSRRYQSTDHTAGQRRSGRAWGTRRASPSRISESTSDSAPATPMATRSQPSLTRGQ